MRTSSFRTIRRKCTNILVYSCVHLQAKLIESSSSSGTQVMDWEQDKKRMRDSIKHERATWDKEKKGLMDQIASLKIKATALHMQKSPPPEWVLEKHQLNVQCSSLQSRVAIMESERTVSSSQHKTQVAKLEKKVELLRKKLLEVMEHAQTLEAKAKEDAKQAASGKKVIAGNTEILYDGNDADSETWLIPSSLFL